MKKSILLTTSLLGFTACSGLGLASTLTYADDSATDTTNITVPVSCSMTGTVNTAHNATLNPGTWSGASGSEYQNGIGKTTLTTFCNDHNGFSVYAIGYTGDDYGTTTLIGNNTSVTIPTKAYESTDTTSNWSMKVTKVTDTSQTFNPNNMTIANSFDSWHAVPDDYAQVAEYKASTGSSTTDTDLGAKLETTYAAYISGAQPADTYIGKVKYVMVHPYDATAPQKPADPISQCPNRVPNVTYMQDVTNANLSSVLASMDMNEQYYLRDKRDETPYCVSKLDDGSETGTLWMTQNLRITGVVSSEGSSFEGDSINISQCDLESGIGTCQDAPNRSSYDIPMTHLSEDVARGSWYNYAAASAGTITTDSNTAETIYSICPTGWHLPNYNWDSTKTAGSVNIMLSVSSDTALAFTGISGGYYSSGTTYAQGNGNWWSSTNSGGSAGPRSRVSLYGSLGSTSLYSGYMNRTSGFFIRCVRTAN